MVLGKPVEVFTKLSKYFDVVRICFDQDCEAYWLERDNAVKNFCASHKIKVVENIGATLWDPLQVIEANTQIQIQVHKYKYKFAHTNTNTNTGRDPESNFDILPKNKSFDENGHISGTVRPTSPRRHSNRSSWRARPEKHLRGSLTCPGNTGEPVAPVLGGGTDRPIEMGSLWVRRLKMTKTKSDLFCSFCPFFGTFRDTGYQQAAQGCIRKVSRTFRRRETARFPEKNPKLSCEASLSLRNGFSSKMNRNKT